LVSQSQTSTGRNPDRDESAPFTSAGFKIAVVSEFTGGRLASPPAKFTFFEFPLDMVLVLH
jgi:hypothetical protein